MSRYQTPPAHFGKKIVVPRPGQSFELDQLHYFKNEGVEFTALSSEAFKKTELIAIDEAISILQRKMAEAANLVLVKGGKQ